MDFHSLTRRELQSLCKLNKIPANITNVAMADALQSLQTVEGIEGFLNVSQSVTDGLVESTKKVEVSSPKVPHNRCKTSTRQKVKIGEAENLQPTAARTTRRGSKQLAGDVEESKNNVVKTPAMPTTRRKALATSSCRNVSNRLNECEEEAKKESTFQKAYSTRRSTRLTEKKSAEPGVKKESEKAIKMNSFVDEMNVASELETGVKKESEKAIKMNSFVDEMNVASELETGVKKESERAIKMNSFVDEMNVASELESLDDVNVTSEEVGKLDEVPENLMGSGKPNAELEDICNAFEKLDVLIEEGVESSVLEEDVDIDATHKTGEEKDCGELDNLKLESDETPNPSDVGDLEGKLKIEEEFDLREKVSSEEAENDEVFNQKTELDGISSPCEDDDSEEKLDIGEKFDASEVSSEEAENDEVFDQKTELDGISSPCEDDDSEEKLDIGEKFDSEDDDSELDGISSPCEDDDSEEKLDIGEKFDASEVSSEEAENDEVFDQKTELDGISSPCEDDDSEEKLDIGEKFDASEVSSAEAENDEVFDQKTELDGISSPCEDDDSEEKLHIGEKFDSEVSSKDISGDNLSAVKDHDLVMVPEEDSDSLIDNNASLESGDEKIDVDAIPFNTENLNGPQELEQEDMVCAVSQMKDQVLESNGCSSMVSDMILSDTENPSEVLESDNFSTADEITKNDMEQVSQNMVDETSDVIPTIDSISTITAEIQDLKTRVFTEFREFPIKKSHSKTPTSLKNMSIVSDDKENIGSGRKVPNVFVDEGKKSKKEKDENDKVKSLHEISMRQLRKQVKALTLKSMNANNEYAASKEATTRPALQVLSENRMVGGETMK
ncbi:hypothetical protein L6452_15648 [Arctium lappa]|uniref:Uncharacterized protein n=1 Tax=Arctium lappa TaxID=4217 RepID=A0ACB9CPH4_ARCLA|nr:hypothetical protein L6452_15648 [Arctium lappa]